MRGPVHQVSLECHLSWCLDHPLTKTKLFGAVALLIVELGRCFGVHTARYGVERVRESSSFTFPLLLVLGAMCL